MSKIYIITTTFDSIDTCKDFANKLINQKLAACCQIHKIDSIYLWKDDINSEQEFQLICKTLKKDELVSFIKSSHPYDIPEIIIQEVKTSEEYFAFVKQACSKFKTQTLLDS